MQIDWTKHLKEEKDKESFRQILKNSSQLTDRLLRILSDRFNDIERRGMKEEDYATAGWETLQAFRNGKLATYKEVADLFDFSEKE